MNASQLAAKMLDWESKRKELDALEGEIQAAVLELKRTQTVGAVKASYSAGRRKFDYEAGGKSASDEVISAYTSVIPEQVIPERTTIDWKGVCKEAKVDVPFKPGVPSVSLKLLS